MPTKSAFPPSSAKDARVLADTIAQRNAGQPMRRLDIFEELKRSPDSSSSRALVTASANYGLTTGSYKAENLMLTALGQRLAVEGDETALVDAVLNIDAFKRFFEKYKNSQLPSEVAGKSYLAGLGIPADRTKACWDMLVENGRFTGLVVGISGSDRVLAREHAIERKFGKDGLKKPELDAGAEGKPPHEEQAEHVKPKLPKGMPSLNINLEIHLPADVRPEVYDAIFGSMRKHLIDVG